MKGQFDLFIAALGYESRSIYLAKELKLKVRHRIALSFGTGEILNFDSNHQWFTRSNFEILTPDQADEIGFVRTLQSVVPVGPNNGKLSVAIDISCMSRPMMALVFEAFLTLESAHDIDLVFLYAPAEFSEPPKRFSASLVSEPVTAFFSGWTDNPNLPASAILGLGYEFNRAFGTIEDLQPSFLSLFLPNGEDKRFDEHVTRLNDAVLRQADPVQVTRYPLLFPSDQVSLLCSTLRGYLEFSRPTIVPLGPKIFFLSALVASYVMGNNACVWRVSADRLGVPHDQRASGTVTQLRVLLQHARSQSRERDLAFA